MISIKENRILHFLFFQVEPFSIPELLGYLNESITKKKINEIRSFLETSQLAYKLSSYYKGHSEWLSRSALYTGKSVILNPTRFELASGILIPGSRCVPFYNPVVLPHNFTLLYNEKKMDKKKVFLSFSEAYFYYQVFGEEYFTEYVLIDNESNKDILLQESFTGFEKLEVTAFDLAEFYWEQKILPGDKLALTVLDWSTAKFEIGIIRKKDIDYDLEKKWCKKIEQSLQDSFQIFGPGSWVEEQVSAAYFLAGESVFSPHATELSSVIDNSKIFDYKPYGVETRLWFKEQTVPAPDVWIISKTSLPSTDFEYILAGLDIPLTEKLLISFSLDSCFRREPNAQPLIQRIKILVEKKDKTDFLPLIQKKIVSSREITSISYNYFSDSTIGPLRNRFINLYLEIISFINFLDTNKIKPKDIPEQRSIILLQLISHCISALESLDFSISDEYQDFDLMWISIESMEYYYLEAKALITDLFPFLHKQKLSLIRGK